MFRLLKLNHHLKPKNTLTSQEEEQEYHTGNNSNNTSKFRYTLDSTANNVFTQEQREFYEENGYILIKNVLNKEEVEYFYNTFDYLVKNPKKRGNITVMRDVSLKKKSRNERLNPDEVTKLQLWSRNELLWKYPMNPNIRKYISAITGNDMRAMHFMVINKPPDSGELSSRHPIHQDQWYFPFGPSDHIVCSWTALEKVHRQNGCLSVIPGSHKSALYDHGYPQYWHGKVNKAYHAILTDKINNIKRERVHLPMEPGDTVFFHPLLLHASGANLTRKTRRSISVHFASSTLCKYSDWKRAGQIKIHKEVNQMANKLGIPGKIPFDMIWKNKSRQVSGNPGSLGTPSDKKDYQKNKERS